MQIYVGFALISVSFGAKHKTYKYKKNKINKKRIIQQFMMALKIVRI